MPLCLNTFLKYLHRTFLSALFVSLCAALSAIILLEAAPIYAEVIPQMSDFQKAPLSPVGSVVPSVLIVLSKNIQMFQHGYPGLVDMDGDGRVDTGFNPGVEYVGYFDSHSCYSYVGRDFVALSGGNYAYGDENGMFVRSGPTMEDDTQAQINAGRPKGLKSYVPSPRSKTGICNRPQSQGGKRSFSGNWLNYIATSRMDAIRKILYGGKRETDSLKETTLIGSFVPPDATVWGTEVRSDDTWQQITPLNAYFDIRKYTIYDKPHSKSAHFFARGSDLGPRNRFFPAIRVLLNANKSSFNLKGKDSVNQAVGVTEPYGRYWDWVLVNRPLPDDKVLKNENYRKQVKIYHIRVKVCDKNNMGATEGCIRYQGEMAHAGDDSYKPAGLIQKYGDGGDPMQFGLMTGTYHESGRKQGGKLRNHVGPVLGNPPFEGKDYIPPVNARTGQINPGGLIKNLDNLRISGRDLSANPVAWEGARYNNTYSWYNPLGEMVYEAVRYLANYQTPTHSYSIHDDLDDPGSSIRDLSQFKYATNAWANKRPLAVGSQCVKPVILIISDTTTDFDGDQVERDLQRPLLKDIKLGTVINSSKLPDRFSKETYLSTITQLEGLDMTGRKSKYYFSKSTTDTCSPKALSGGLNYVKGLCPGAPSSEGGFSAVAASYFAHIHDMTGGIGERGSAPPKSADVYAVTMSAAFPELSFKVKGNGEKKVSILPGNTSSLVNSGKQMMGILNYFILEWEVDRNGYPFHVKIKVNFSDKDQGDDWEGDGQVTYTVDMLTPQTTPASMRDLTPVKIDSGDPQIKGRRLYKFKNPLGANKKSDFIETFESRIAGILVHSEWTTPGTSAGLAMGYTITGTTRDGTYLDITMNRPSLNPNLTPPGCDYLGSSSKLANGCGKVVTNLKSQARAFIFRHVSTGAQNLPNPLQLSAKYGGFNDRNRNGVPDRGEWEGRDGLPSNYFQAANIAELPHKLETAFKSIAENPQLKRASAPSIYSLPGGGISLETVYYPLYANPENGSERVSWVGTIFALFVDKYGNLREDSDHDLRLTVVNGPKGIIGDHVVSFNPDNSQASSHPCKGISETLSRCFDPYGNNQLQHFSGEKGSPKNIHKIVPIFDTGHWLSSLDSQKILLGPRKHTTPATITNGQRRIYYAYLENSGKSASDNYKTSLLDSSPGSLTARNFLSRVIFDNYQEALPGFKSKLEAAEALVAWVQGVEHPKLRNRSIGDPWTDDHAKVVWRLGDIVNSKPIALGPPASNFHLFYKDLDYLAFMEKYKSRRRMVYFGANDGMLHAVNLGFASYPRGGAHGPAIALTPGNKVPATPHELGAELWAFIPASVLPHLSWLASPLYKHSYYVDQKPLITDAKIKGEWRTILIAGLGLGGRPIMKPTAEDPQAAKSPYYFSEVFCLDITDPEKEPVLLWRHSEMELGLSVGLPQVISSEGKFYCIIPSGPMSDTLAPKSEPPSINYGFKSGYDGYSKQNARLIVIDLDKGEEVSQGKSQKDFLVAPEPDSFFNNPFLPIAQRRELPWSNHALYYGLTISRGLEHCEDKGAVYRLQLADEKGKPLPVSSWKLRRFFNTARPVSAAVNSTYDSHGNLFVIFGTGKLFGEDDLRPCATMPSDRKCLENHEQYLYGLKEDLSDEGFMTFADRSSEESAILDLSGAQLRRNGYVVNIKANKILTIPTGGSVPYQAVQNAIASPKVLGYKRKLESGKIFYPKEPHSNEMVLSQVKLVSRGNGGSLAVFTSFEPTIKGCGSGSYAYLHMVDSFTGLPHPDSSDIFFPASTKESAKTDEVLPGVITLGEGLPTEAFLEETAQGTKVSALDSESGVHTLQIPKASSVHSGVVSWKEVQDRGFGLSKKAMSMGLEY